MIRHCRRWLQAWLLPSERPWQQALAENRARMVALEERMAELELILKNEERAASLAPDQVHPNLAVGAMAIRLTLWPKALAAFDTVLSIESTCEEAHAGRIESLAGAGEHEEAEAAYKKAIELLKPELKATKKRRRLDAVCPVTLYNEISKEAKRRKTAEAAGN